MFTPIPNSLGAGALTLDFMRRGLVAWVRVPVGPLVGVGPITNPTIVSLTNVRLIGAGVAQYEISSVSLVQTINAGLVQYAIEDVTLVRVIGAGVPQYTIED